MRPTRVEKSHLKNANHCTRIIHEKKRCLHISAQRVPSVGHLGNGCPTPDKNGVHTGTRCPLLCPSSERGYLTKGCAHISLQRVPWSGTSLPPDPTKIFFTHYIFAHGALMLSIRTLLLLHNVRRFLSPALNGNYSGRLGMDH